MYKGGGILLHLYKYTISHFIVTVSKGGGEEWVVVDNTAISLIFLLGHYYIQVFDRWGGVGAQVLILSTYNVK
jgi:hypothetical protein